MALLISVLFVLQIGLGMLVQMLLAKALGQPQRTNAVFSDSEKIYSERLSSVWQLVFPHIKLQAAISFAFNFITYFCGIFYGGQVLYLSLAVGAINLMTASVMSYMTCYDAYGRVLGVHYGRMAAKVALWVTLMVTSLAIIGCAVIGYLQERDRSELVTYLIVTNFLLIFTIGFEYFSRRLEDRIVNGSDGLFSQSHLESNPLASEISDQLAGSFRKNVFYLALVSIILALSMMIGGLYSGPEIASLVVWFSGVLYALLMGAWRLLLGRTDSVERLGKVLHRLSINILPREAFSRGVLRLGFIRMLMPFVLFSLLAIGSFGCLSIFDVLAKEVWVSVSAFSVGASWFVLFVIVTAKYSFGMFGGGLFPSTRVSTIFDYILLVTSAGLCAIVTSGSAVSAVPDSIGSSAYLSSGSLIIVWLIVTPGLRAFWGLLLLEGVLPESRLSRLLAGRNYDSIILQLGHELWSCWKGQVRRPAKYIESRCGNLSLLKAYGMVQFEEDATGSWYRITEMGHLPLFYVRELSGKELN